MLFSCLLLPSSLQDNYLDIIIDASDMQTAALLGSATVEAFHTDEGYAPLYNPGASSGRCRHCHRSEAAGGGGCCRHSHRSQAAAGALWGW